MERCTFFGLDTAILLDLLAIGLLVYSRRAHSLPLGAPSPCSMFTVADGLWVAASIVVLLVFCGQLTPVARLLLIAVGLAVDVFATLQFRAARRNGLVRCRSPDRSTSGQRPGPSLWRRYGRSNSGSRVFECVSGKRR